MPDLVLNAIQPPAGRATILVVDDTEANRYAIVRHLQKADYAVLESATGIDGLTRAFTHMPDLIILDVRLPDISGFEIARQLRADERTAAIPLLHISASFTDTQTQVQGLDNGADGYLTHPLEPAVLLATVRSLLRTREAERRAHATARAWRATFDTIGEGVCVTDQQGIIVRCNQAFADMVEQPYATLVQRPLPAVLPGVRLQPEPPFITFESDPSDSGEPFLVHGRWLRASAVALSSDTGVPAGAVCVLTDMTRQRQADERVRQVQQLEATGRLAGGVAHEINNMMTIILGYSTFVLERVDRGDRSHADLEEIHRAASRAAEVARQLLTFSRRQPVRPTVLDLSTVLRDFQRTMSRLLGADRELRLALPASSTWVRVDRGQFEQVLVNLALNARDAMSTGGVLTVRVSAVQLDAAFADDHPGVGVRLGPYVRIDVEDTGHGMDAATLNRAFEPFFTTKEIGAGTGLGLATVYGIIKQANGYIWIDSAPRRGAVFSLYLPMIKEEVAAADDQGTAGVAQGTYGNETVLVIEDEPAVRALARRSLEGVGYQVLDAENGLEALDRLREVGAAVRLVVTDVVMPGMGGAAFAQEAWARHPELPILFMSGYADDEIAHRQQLPAGACFIQKPFEPATLVLRVREMLEGAGHRSS